MKKLRSFIGYIILAVNALFAVLFLLSAFSSYINPIEYPVRSCIGLAFPIFLAIVCCFFVFWLFIRARYALLSLVVLLIAYQPIRSYIPFNVSTVEPDNYPIKILSYNTMSLGGAVDKDKESPVIAYMLDSDADIMCLQEYNTPASKRNGNVGLMKKLFKKYPYRSIEKAGNSSGENELALFSKYPIISSKHIPYNSLYNGSMLYSLKVGNDTLWVINNHLESNKLVLEDKVVYEQMLKDPNAEKIKEGLPHLVKKLGEAAAIRAQQANYIEEVINSLPANSYILVCGDFNDPPNSYTHRVISKNLIDAFVKSGNGLGISYNQHKLYFRIDHILTSKNIRSYDCQVVKDTKESDHYPISCFITLDPK